MNDDQIDIHKLIRMAEKASVHHADSLLTLQKECRARDCPLCLFIKEILKLKNKQ